MILIDRLIDEAISLSYLVIILSDARWDNLTLTDINTAIAELRHMRDGIEHFR